MIFDLWHAEPSTAHASQDEEITTLTRLSNSTSDYSNCVPPIYLKTVFISVDIKQDSASTISTSPVEQASSAEAESTSAPIPSSVALTVSEDPALAEIISNLVLAGISKMIDPGAVGPKRRKRIVGCHADICLLACPVAV